MRGGCGEPFGGPKPVLTHPASIGVPHDVRIVRTLEPRLLWPQSFSNRLNRDEIETEILKAN